ncbi:MAG: tetratricopeptide repeat protein [Paludibacter sp.]|nr:tetratricopeptide repeat protein [Paludibacter sp.]
MNRKLSFLPEDEPDELIRRYEAFLSNKSSSGYFDVEEMEHIVDYYLRKGRTRDGSKALELGFRLHPGNPGLLTKRAKIYLASGHASKAYQILETTASPYDYEVKLLKIDALIRLDRPKEATLIAERLIAEEEQEKDVVCLDIAFIYLAHFEMDQAFVYLQIGEQFNPSNIELLFELAFCYEQQAEIDSAISIYNRILKLDPYSPEAWFNLGQIYFTSQDFTNALNAYEYALVIRPEDSLTVLQKAHSHFQLAHYLEAIEEYLNYSNMAAEHWQTWLFIGESYERLEQFNEAIIYYSRSLKEQPDNYEALTGIAICLMEQEKYQDSLVFSRRAIEIREEAPDAWVYLAEGLIGVDKVDEALQAYIKSVRIDPDQPETYMAIGNICMDKGDFTLALEYYKQAMELNNENELQNINIFMAVAYYRTGQRQAALLALDKAIDENLDSLKIFQELCPDADF